MRDVYPAPALQAADTPSRDVFSPFGLNTPSPAALLLRRYVPLGREAFGQSQNSMNAREKMAIYRSLCMSCRRFEGRGHIHEAVIQHFAIFERRTALRV